MPGNRETLPLPPVIVFCHKGDYFLTKVAVSSIRYYYPDVEIYLVKDSLNGPFSTQELERLFHVRTLALEQTDLGWATGKILVLLARLGLERYVLMDSDIVFVGHALETIATSLADHSFVISPELNHSPSALDFSDHYYDPSRIRTLYPDFAYPGFTFNAGCFGATEGCLFAADVSLYFDPTRFPYWTDLGRQLLPTRDQSMLNILLPLKSQRNQLAIGAVPFMWWFLEPPAKEIEMADIKAATYPYVIHWAGGKRIPFFPAMERGDILLFFLRQYFASLPFGQIRFLVAYIRSALHYFSWTLPRHLLGIERIIDWTKIVGRQHD